MKAIIDIATHGASADERRRTEGLRSIKTLNELTHALQLQGFKISRSGAYLRLLPRRMDTIEGKKHVTTVPVKLIKAHTQTHAKHIDSKFASTSIFHLEQVASLIGPKHVFFISQDDKARVPIGITAANKQAPLLMHMEYKVTLPDHDWVVASQHKLIPSVYAGIIIKENGCGNKEFVTYSGPTYVAIRSGKHSSSTSLSHALDFERILKLDIFNCITRNTMQMVKPVGIFIVDGGPDENPRYNKVILTAIHHFIKNNLDALFIATNAPGRSAFNRVERRMAPLSKELAGLILPHDHFGTHLDKNARTISDRLEQQNFQYAGETLAEVWSQMVIDGYQVLSEFVPPDSSELNQNLLKGKSLEWQGKHVKSSQYILQIVKCFDTNCCLPPRSPYLTLFPERFLPPPIPVVQTEDGLVISTDKGKYLPLFENILLLPKIKPPNFNNFKKIPYDIMCPSINKDLPRRICKKCGLYFASFSAMTAHQQMCDNQLNMVNKVLPMRIAAKRQRELMVSIKKSEIEDLEWIDEENIESGVSVPEFMFNNPQIEIITVQDNMVIPWETT